MLRRFFHLVFVALCGVRAVLRARSQVTMCARRLGVVERAPRDALCAAGAVKVVGELDVCGTHLLVGAEGIPFFASSPKF